MKGLITGIAIATSVFVLLFVIYKITKRERHRRMADRFPIDPYYLGFYVGHPNRRSPRLIAPLRPNIYWTPDIPTFIRRPHRFRRTFW